MTVRKPFDGICPFCGENDFDLVGLKIHFERGWCNVYAYTQREDLLNMRRLAESRHGERHEAENTK